MPNKPVVNQIPVDPAKVVAVWRAGSNYRQTSESFGITRERVRQIVFEDHNRFCTKQWVGPGRDSWPNGYCECVSEHKLGRKRLLEERIRSNPKIKDDYTNGIDVGEIATKHSLRRKDVLDFVESLSDRDKVVRETNMWTGCRQTGISNDELLEYIRGLNVKLGHTPSRKDYDKEALVQGWPSSQTVCIRFDFWGSALEKAGISPSSLVSGMAKERSDKHWTQERMLDGLHYLFDDLGEVPTIAEYRRIYHDTPWLPSDQLIRRATGGWPMAKMHIIDTHEAWVPKFSKIELVPPKTAKGTAKGRPRKVQVKGTP